MASPINLSGLPVTTSVSANDLMLIRQGLTDYKVALSIIQSIKLDSLDPLGSANSTDLMYIYRTGQGGYSIQFSQVGFLSGTQMWFFQGSVPLSWKPISGYGDQLLGISDPSSSKLYNGTISAGNSGGNWQQNFVAGTPNGGLLINQIPNHTHNIPSNNSSGGSIASGYFRSATASTYVSASTGMNLSENEINVSDPHDHGALWRPLASVGILGVKYQ